MNNYRTSKNQFQEDLITKHNGLYDLFVILFGIMFLVSFWVEATEALNVLVIVLYFTCTFTQFKEKRYGCFFFYVTFFLFLLDTVFFGIFNKEFKYKFLSSEIENHVLLCLGVSIISIYVGSLLRINRRITFGRREEKKIESDYNHIASYKLRLFLKWTFLFCGVFSVIEALVKALFVSATSYLAYYSEFETPLPYFARWLSSISPILFYFFLGTRPSKKEARLPVTIYLLVGIISLFFGQRNILVVRGIVVLCYFLIRNKYSNDGEVWISKNQIRMIVILVPVGVFFMGFWGTFRYGQEFSSEGIWESIRSALLGQGNNIQILDLEYRYGHLLPDRKYAIGGIITFLHNNLFGRLLGLQQITTKMHTQEIITDGYSFEAALMSIEAKSAFLLGYGMGSCYIAELINSFGMIGVIIGNLMYGVVLRKLNEIRLNSFLANGFALYMFQRMLMAPRATFDGFISGTFQIAHLFIALMCWYLSKYVWPEQEETSG